MKIEIGDKSIKEGDFVCDILENIKLENTRKKKSKSK